MSDLFNGWPEDGEPVLTMSDEEVVRWLNKTQDTIVEQAAKIERQDAALNWVLKYCREAHPEGDAGRLAAITTLVSNTLEGNDD